MPPKRKLLAAARVKLVASLAKARGAKAAKAKDRGSGVGHVCESVLMGMAVTPQLEIIFDTVKSSR
jgi:hypothetical protein